MASISNKKTKAWLRAVNELPDDTQSVIAYHSLLGTDAAAYKLRLFVDHDNVYVDVDQVREKRFVDTVCSFVYSANDSTVECTVYDDKINGFAVSDAYVHLLVRLVMLSLIAEKGNPEVHDMLKTLTGDHVEFIVNRGMTAYRGKGFDDSLPLRTNAIERILPQLVRLYALGTLYWITNENNSASTSHHATPTAAPPSQLASLPYGLDDIRKTTHVDPRVRATALPLSHAQLGGRKVKSSRTPVHRAKSEDPIAMLRKLIAMLKNESVPAQRRAIVAQQVCAQLSKVAT